MINILDLHAGDIGPGLVGKGVIVQELVGKDQGSGEEAILCSLASVDNLVGLFEIDHQLLDVLERQENDARGEQSCAENI